MASSVGVKKKRIFSLDVCKDAFFTYGNIGEIQDKGLRKLFLDLMDEYIELNSVETKQGKAAILYDILTIFYLISPESFSFEKKNFKIVLEGEERGRMLEISEERNILIIDTESKPPKISPHINTEDNAEMLKSKENAKRASASLISSQNFVKSFAISEITKKSRSNDVSPKRYKRLKKFVLVSDFLDPNEYQNILEAIVPIPASKKIYPVYFSN